MEFFVQATLVVLAVAAALWAQIWFERRRTAQFAALADEMGLSFTPEVTIERVAPLKKFELFSVGSTKRVACLIEGATDQVELAMFDLYQGLRGGSNQRQITVVHLRCEDFNLPHFCLGPEFAVDRALGLDGANDIDFHSHPKFSNSRVLNGEPESAVRAVFTEELLTLIEQQDRYFSLEGEGRDLVVHVRRRLPPKELRGHMNLALMIARYLQASQSSELAQSATT